MSVKQISPSTSQARDLPEEGSWPESRHIFDDKSVWAINAALASNRPLLIRGEPGTGKSQLARAAAHVLEWPFYSCVVNARFEPEDLLFRFDAVARLAKARGCSLGALVREAVRQQFGLVSREERVAAAERLSALALPVGSVEEMIAESVPSVAAPSH